MTHTHTHTVGRTPLYEGSARRRDLYLTTHNIHKRQTSVSAVGLEPAISASERPQIHAEPFLREMSTLTVESHYSECFHLASVRNLLRFLMPVNFCQNLFLICDNPHTCFCISGLKNPHFSFLFFYFPLFYFLFFPFPFLYFIFFPFHFLSFLFCSFLSFSFLFFSFLFLPSHFNFKVSGY